MEKQAINIWLDQKTAKDECAAAWYHGSCTDNGLSKIAVIMIFIRKIINQIASYRNKNKNIVGAKVVNAIYLTFHSSMINQT